MHVLSLGQTGQPEPLNGGYSDPQNKSLLVCTFVTSSTKIVSYSLHKVQKLEEILPQQGRHMENGSQNNDSKVKSSGF